jgi:hypothetical protein
MRAFKLLFVSRKIMYFAPQVANPQISNPQIRKSKRIYGPHIANPQTATFGEGLQI